MNNNLKNIHVQLKSARIDKFNSIKNKLELNSDVDVMRTCLDIAYNQLIINNLTLKPELLEIAEKITQSLYLKKKYLIFSVNDILNDALN